MASRGSVRRCAALRVLLLQTTAVMAMIYPSSITSITHDSTLPAIPTTGASSSPVYKYPGNSSDTQPTFSPVIKSSDSSLDVPTPTTKFTAYPSPATKQSETSLEIGPPVSTTPASAAPKLPQSTLDAPQPNSQPPSSSGDAPQPNSQSPSSSIGSSPQAVPEQQSSSSPEPSSPQQSSSGTGQQQAAPSPSSGQLSTSGSGSTASSSPTSTGQPLTGAARHLGTRMSLVVAAVTLWSGRLLKDII